MKEKGYEIVNHLKSELEKNKPKNICPYCGKSISLNARFCSKCGKKID